MSPKQECTRKLYINPCPHGHCQSKAKEQERGDGLPTLGPRGSIQKWALLGAIVYRQMQKQEKKQQRAKGCQPRDPVGVSVSPLKSENRHWIP